MFGNILKAVVPVAIILFCGAVAGCTGRDVTINGKEGVPLAELDQRGAAPTELVVAANARVFLTTGDSMEIAVEGDTQDALRFVLEENTLGITLAEGRKIENGEAIVRVTMPAPTSLVMAGTSRIVAQTVASGAEIVVGGAGKIDLGTVSSDKLEITIGGSGSVIGLGKTSQLEINIGGSGSVDMPGLEADRADISIGGSGNVAFASNGKVDATIAGSGNVTVIGSATCEVKTFGSGKLTCRPATRPGDTSPED